MNGPQTLQGGLIRVAERGVLRQTLNFQYNPEQITRTLRPDGGSGEVAESLRFELVFDAADALAQGDPGAVEHGIAPQLAALTGLLEDSRAAPRSWIERLLPQTDDTLTVFVWGNSQAVPVGLEKLDIRERLFDSRLNPIHAVAAVELRVLAARELAGHRYGLELLQAYRAARRDLADSIGFGPG